MNKFKTISTWVLVVLGCTMLSTYGIVRWTEQQVLNTDSWVATMSTLPKDQAVAESIGKQIVDKVFTDSDITESLKEALPPKLEFLAPTVTGFLHTKADELATKVIMSDKFTTLWSDANRTAHEKLVAALRAPQSSQDAKVLPYKIKLAKAQDWLQNAAENNENQALVRAAQAGDRIETFNASLRTGLNQARAFVRATDNLYILLPYAVMASFLAALALARKRSKVLIGIGIGVVTLNVAAIAGVNFLRPALLNMLQDEAYKPLFAALWNALLPPFLEYARSLVVLGLLLILAVVAWRKGVFGLMLPKGLKANRRYKQVVQFWHNVRLQVAEVQTYIFGVATGLAALLVAFWPQQTPQGIVRVVLWLISLISLTAILAERKPVVSKTL